MGSSNSTGTGSPTPSPTPWPTPLITEFNFSTYYESEAYNTLSYAYGAYCDTADLQNWDCNHCSSNFDITSNGAGVIDTDDLRAFMGYDHDYDRVVLSFRGTANIENWISNIDILQTVYPHYDNGAGSLHSGFYSNWLSLEDHGLSTMIKSMFAGYPDADLLITGHSLGGALAEIAAFDISHNSDYSTLSIGSIRVIDFGTPRWADETIATRYNEVIDSNWRIVNEWDAVPQIPLQEMGYHHTGTMVHYTDSENREYTICDSSGEEHWLIGLYNINCWVSMYMDVTKHNQYFNEEKQCSQDSSALAASEKIMDDLSPKSQITPSVNADRMSVIQKLERDLKIPDKLPTVTVAVVAVMVFAVIAFWRCGFRCSIWRKQQKPYKHVDLKGDVASDSDIETDVDVQAVQPLNP